MRILIELTGGLGNQFFGYAFGYALSRRLGAELWLDTSMQDNGRVREPELLNYDVKYDKRITYAYSSGLLNRSVVNKIRRRRLIGWHTHIYKEKEAMVYDELVNKISSDTYFKGFWQNQKYFLEYREDLLKMLQPKGKRSESVYEAVEAVSRTNSVAVHIRRGDYVSIGCDLKMEYYDKALELMNQKAEKGFEVFVFSDDIKFCKNFLSKYAGKINIIYPEYESDNRTMDDLLIMSRCKHIIMANSSYSWWAAWLNRNAEKIVICPQTGIWGENFYLEDWIKITA